uniref:non-specific serine/threonine protein kinase n=1 Tax=Steinernema glaseri TaxID=37863 RepID=A0A1I8A7G7_9BILA
MGELVAGQYVILKKLGYGSNSTVFLAYNRNATERSKSKFVALKFVKSNHVATQRAKAELKIFKKMQPSKYVVSYIDSFMVEGCPGENHLCIVYEALGASITCFYPSCPFPLPTVRRVVLEMTNVLKSVHDQDVVHYNIQPKNYLLASTEKGLCLEALQTLRLFHDDKLQSDRPFLLCAYHVNQEEIEFLNGHEKYKDRTREVQEEIEKLYKELPDDHGASLRLKLANFKNAVKLKDDNDLIPRYGLPHRRYRPPEIVLEHKKVFKNSDIWSLACSIYELASREGGHLFDVGVNAKWERDLDLDHLARMLSLYQEFDGNGLKDARKYSEYFDERNEVVARGRFAKRSIEGRLLSEVLEAGHVDQLPKEEAKLIGEFLQGMVQWNPEDRSTASECLKHPYLEGPISNDETVFEDFGCIARDYSDDEETEEGEEQAPQGAEEHLPEGDRSNNTESSSVTLDEDNSCGGEDSQSVDEAASDCDERETLEFEDEMSQPGPSNRGTRLTEAHCSQRQSPSGTQESSGHKLKRAPPKSTDTEPRITRSKRGRR